MADSQDMSAQRDMKQIGAELGPDLSSAALPDIERRVYDQLLSAVCKDASILLDLLPIGGNIKGFAGPGSDPQQLCTKLVKDAEDLWRHAIQLRKDDNLDSQRERICRDALEMAAAAGTVGSLDPSPFSANSSVGNHETAALLRLDADVKKFLLSSSALVFPYIV